MPKKTREQKMAAAIRRMKQQLAAGEESEPTEKVLNQPRQATYTVDIEQLAKVPPSKGTAVDLDRYNYAYVAGDLKKLLMVAAAAVAAEIVLNLTMRASFAKLFLRSLGLEI